LSVILGSVLNKFAINSIVANIVMALYIFIIASFFGLFIVISDKVLDKVVNPYAIQVFNTLMAAVLPFIVA